MDVNTAFSNIPCTVYGKVLRLHVVADSDSEDDQRLKLDVRDELLRVSDKLFCECESVESALAVAKKNKLEVFVIEFTKKSDWIAVMNAYCKHRGYHAMQVKKANYSKE
jgi:hypothetical protein